MKTATSIPVLDIEPLHGGSSAELARLARLFYNAYSETGFSYVTNHGVSQDVIDRVFRASRRFHAMPRKDKLAIALDSRHRGFIALNTSTDVNSKLATVTKPNQSESFIMMREDAPDSREVIRGDYLSGPNQWPDLPGFRRDVMVYNEILTELGHKLMSLAAMAIGTDPERIMPAFEVPTTWLRLLYYPPSPPQAEEDLYGSAPHTDFGCLTILAQDDVGGLQVRSPAGRWIDVPGIRGAFVVNVGDMLHRWSNGRLRSTPHRVINRSGRERYSCPFFYDPNVNTEISPLPCCIGAGSPAAYESVNFGRFLENELQSAYTRHQK